MRTLTPRLFIPQRAVWDRQAAYLIQGFGYAWTPLLRDRLSIRFVHSVDGIGADVQGRMDERRIGWHLRALQVIHGFTAIVCIFAFTAAYLDLDSLKRECSQRCCPSTITVDSSALRRTARSARDDDALQILSNSTDPLNNEVGGKKKQNTNSLWLQSLSKIKVSNFSFSRIFLSRIIAKFLQGARINGQVLGDSQVLHWW